MYNQLRKQAKKRVEAKMAFYICAIVFFFTTVVLLALSYYLPSVAVWLRLPIPVFLMVLGILYFAAFGPPGAVVLSEDWKEDEIEREMMKIYRYNRPELPPMEDLSETEMLELKELERLKKKWDWDDDYV